MLVLARETEPDDDGEAFAPKRPLWIDRPPVAEPVDVVEPVETVDTVEQPRADVGDVELLHAVRLRAGVDEYAALHEAMRTTPPPGCVDDPRFTAVRLSPAQAAALQAVCDDCPLLDLCGAFADAGQPVVGFWAGRAHGLSPRKVRKNLRHSPGWYRPTRARLPRKIAHT